MKAAVTGGLRDSYSWKEKIYTKLALAYGLALMSLGWPSVSAFGDGRPIIQSFQSNDYDIVDGKSVTLTWVVSGAKHLYIKGFGSANGLSSVEVTPPRTQTYTLVAKNEAGATEASLLILTRAPGSRQPLRFQSGFGGSTKLVPRPSSPEQAFNIIGSDVLDMSDWVNNLLNPADFNGTADIYFEAGIKSDRFAKIISEPTKTSNKVLHFWLNKPAIVNGAGYPLKGRIQMGIGRNQEGFKQLYVSVRLFLLPDFNVLKKYPESIDWLTISEWWNNGGWTGEAFPFRMTVGIVKPDPAVGSSLRFQVKADSKVGEKWSEDYWHMTSETSVPIGRWLTLEYYILEGDAKTGRFYMAMTPDGGSRKVIFDIHNTTHHPDDPAPDGIKDLNPMKLYTSNEVIEFVNSKNRVLQMYWDDLIIRSSD